MNNDDQKIVWKKGGTQNNDSALQIDEEQKIENDDIDLGSDVIQDLAQRSGDHQQNKNNSTEETSVDDLKAEIEKAFSNPENVEVPSESLASDVFDADSLDANFEDLKAHINENSGVNESLDAEMSSSNNDSEDSLKSLQDDISSLLGKSESFSDKQNLNDEKDTLRRVENSELMDTFSVDTQKNIVANDDLSPVEDKIIWKKSTVEEKSEDFKIDSAEKENLLVGVSQSGSTATLAAINAIKERQGGNSPLEVESSPIDDIKASIQSQFSITESSSIGMDASPAPLEGTKESEQKEETKKARRVDQTYYSDLSNAMGSNEPATMSELLRRSRFENKEKAILSPSSKKNIAYISGAIILIIGVISIFTFLLSKKDPVQYITNVRVSSLVYSDKDTGINTTDIDKEKIKQSIRKVAEEKLPEGTLHQLYYLGTDKFGNTRRLGLKQILEQTNNLPPALLLENVDNNFMHGVYKTDKNHPFIILKTQSYDRALEGMKEWEPTIIDDLSPYFDLPNEAGDRSLMDAGFSDDLIKNKNVRVARFLPRDVDRRGGIFNIFGGSDNEAIENTEITEGGEATSVNLLTKTLALLKKTIKKGIINSSDFSYAQTFQTQNGGVTNIGNTTSSDMSKNTICYEAVKECYDKLSGSKVNYQAGNTSMSCSNILVPNGKVVKKGEALWSSVNTTTSGYSCVNTNETAVIDNTLKNKQVCFDFQTGNRLDPTLKKPADTCFAAYNCSVLECKEGSKTVPYSDLGKPGVVCNERPLLNENEINNYTGGGQKICRAYPELLNLQNIKNKNICFDSQDNYIESVPVDSYGNMLSGYNCISPINRDATMCVTKGDGKVVFKDPQIPESAYDFCVKALAGTTSLVDEQFQQNDTEFKSKARVISLGLYTVSLLIKNSETKKDIVKAADFFGTIASGNIMFNEAQKDAIGVIKNLESILTIYDPNKKTQLSSIVEYIKASFGYKHNVAWVTLGNGFPRGFELPNGTNIYAGQTVDVVNPIQQSLVLIGMMNPVSVTGKLDLVTQDAISSFQSINGLVQTGVIDQETLNLLNNIMSGQGSVYGGNQAAVINDYFDLDEKIGLGSYGQSVQSLQILLYAEGYDIVNINGLYDKNLLYAVQEYQKDNGLELANSDTGILSRETLESLNDLIRKKGYLGTGFDVTKRELNINNLIDSAEIGDKSQDIYLLQELLKQEGFYEGVVSGEYTLDFKNALESFGALTTNGSIFSNGIVSFGDALSGKGLLAGIGGPGEISFGANSAFADESLSEGDIVLMYTFLDESTILITRSSTVINEIIKRRALNDIFNKAEKKSV